MARMENGTKIVSKDNFVRWFVYDIVSTQSQAVSDILSKAANNVISDKIITLC